VLRNLLLDLGRESTNRIIDHNIKDISLGPHRQVHIFDAYNVNGYHFHTETYSIGKTTLNSEICIKRGWYDNNEHDYYGILEEIVEPEYRGLHNKVVLFKCHWFDVPGGVKINKDYSIVEVKRNSFLKTYESFVFAAQATQIYYLSYPSTKRERRH
jgi:Domain of unknown function (DUF4216)